MSHCDNHQWLCHIAILIKVHITMWQAFMVKSHYNIHQSLCQILTSINGYITLKRSLKFTSHCNNHYCLCHITTFIKVHVTLQQPSMVMVNYGWPCLIIIDYGLLYLIVVDYVWIFFGWIIVDHAWLQFDHVTNMVDYCWMWVDHGCVLLTSLSLTTWCKILYMPQCSIATHEFQKVTWTLINVALWRSHCTMSHCVALWCFSKFTSHCFQFNHLM